MNHDYTVHADERGFGVYDRNVMVSRPGPNGDRWIAIFATRSEAEDFIANIRRANEDA